MNEMETKKKYKMLGVAMCINNPSLQETEAEGFQVQDHPRLHSEPSLTKKKSMKDKQNRKNLR
jgi:hypothetical protein